jgi:hypothetical protein
MSEFAEKFDELDALGIKFRNQEDARLRWLEREVARLGDYVEALEGRLLTKIDGKSRPHWPEPEEELA